MPSTKEETGVEEENEEQLYLDVLAFVKKQEELGETLRVLKKEQAGIKNGLLQAIDRAKIKKLKKKFLN